MNDTVARLYPQLRGVAASIAVDVDENLLDDLVQHMALCLLESKPDNTDSWYLQFAANRARNYLKHENLQPLNFTDVGLNPYGEPEQA